MYISSSVVNGQEHHNLATELKRLRICGGSPAIVELWGGWVNNLLHTYYDDPNN
jgi:hypothetical protein